MTMDEDREILAAEYALGTLDASERAEAERLIVSDTAFAAQVAYWERRLALLAEAVDGVEPPDSVWQNIIAGLRGAAVLAGTPSGSAEIVYLTRKTEPLAQRDLCRGRARRLAAPVHWCSRRDAAGAGSGPAMLRCCRPTRCRRAFC